MSIRSITPQTAKVSWTVLVLILPSRHAPNRQTVGFVCFAYRQAGTPVISVINPAAIIYKVMWNLSRAAVWVKLVSFGLAFLVTFLATLFIARKVACLVSAITSRLRPANVALNSADPGSTGAVPEPEAEDDAIAVVREHITRKWERFEGVWYMFLFAEIVVITFGSHFFNVDGVLWTTLVCCCFNFTFVIVLEVTHVGRQSRVLA